MFFVIMIGSEKRGKTSEEEQKAATLLLLAQTSMNMKSETPSPDPNVSISVIDIFSIVSFYFVLKLLHRVIKKKYVPNQN